MNTPFKLDSRNFKGIWAGPPIFWDEAFRLDEETTAENFRRICRIPPHGIYILGSTGEFYALNFEEFKQLTDLFVQAVSPFQIPTQVGCGATSTGEIIRRMEYAWDKGTHGVQVTLPYWSELSDREVLHFFQELHHACPDTPIIHYNIPRAKRFLTGQDYRRILEVCPNLIGTKFTYAGSHFHALQESIKMTPQLAYFAGENLLASVMQLGAKGSCSALIYVIPQVVLKLYEKAEQGAWNEAMPLQQKIADFLSDSFRFWEEHGMGTFDPVVDTGMSLASGFLKGHPRVRSPYIGWTEEEVGKYRKWLEEHYGHLLASTSV